MLKLRKLQSLNIFRNSDIRICPVPWWRNLIRFFPLDNNAPGAAHNDKKYSNQNISLKRAKHFLTGGDAFSTEKPVPFSHSIISDWHLAEKFPDFSIPDNARVSRDKELISGVVYIFIPGAKWFRQAKFVFKIL